MTLVSLKKSKKFFSLSQSKAVSLPSLPLDVLRRLITFVHPQSVIQLVKSNRLFHSLSKTTLLKKFDDIRVYVVVNEKSRRFLAFGPIEGGADDDGIWKRRRGICGTLTIDKIKFSYRKFVTKSNKEFGYPKRPVIVFRLTNKKSLTLDYLKENFRQLFPVLFRHFGPIEMQTNVEMSDLLRLLDLLPSTISSLKFDGRECKMETSEHLVEFLQRRSSVNTLSAQLFHSLPRPFFEKKEVQQLNSVLLDTPDDISPPCLNDDLICAQKWESCSLEQSEVTSRGLNRLLREWACEERELILWAICLSPMTPSTVDDIIQGLPVKAAFPEREFVIVERKDRKMIKLSYFTDTDTHSLVRKILVFRVWDF